MSINLVPFPSPPAPARAAEYERVKHDLHTEIVASLDTAATLQVGRAELESQLRARLAFTVKSRDLPLTRTEQDRLVDDILDEILGYGPLERLLRADEISDILVNGPETIYVERRGHLEKVDARFRDDAHLRHVIDRIVSRVGRRVDESNPMVDARLPDGSRFNAVIPPLAVDGAIVSIRRFGLNPILREDLLRLRSVPGPALDLLEGCVRAKLNILVSGGTGSGKTTLLNVLSSCIPPTERVITIEDAAELRLQQPHVVRLETRTQNLEGAGEISTRDLVRNALRMRPDRIIVGEIRGDEAIDMLQAMNTGHEGSISTIHANGPRHALSRLETMVGLAMGNITNTAIREMIAEAIDLIVQVNRLPDGTRRVTSITEVTGASGSVIATQEIFRFVQDTVDTNGRVRGRFLSTDIFPMFAQRFTAAGLLITPQMLDIDEEV